MTSTDLNLTVKEFCRSAKISVSTLYALWGRGEGPAITRIGTRVLVSQTSAIEWLKKQEVPARENSRAA